MAKFCEKCGTQIEDDARVCGNCGSFVEPDSSKMNPSDILKNVDGESVKKITESVKKFLPAIAAVIVLIFIVGALANSGYKGTVKKIFKSLENANEKTLISCVSDFELDWYYDGDKAERKDDVKDKLEDRKDYLEEYYGKNFKIKYKIIESEKLSDDDFEEYLEYLEDYTDYSTKKIKAVRDVEVEVTIKGSEDEDTEEYSLRLIKEGGKWKILSHEQVL